MNEKPLICVRVFTLPGEERSVNEVMNDPDNTVVEEERTPCPKEGVILLYLKWERWGDDIDEGGALL